MDMSTTTGLHSLVTAIMQHRHMSANAVMLVGICGGVASGKSRFAKALEQELSGVHLVPTMHFPLELWINRAAFDTGVYTDRFYLDELRGAIHAMRNGHLWLCPRFDLIKLFKRHPKLEPHVLWFESAEVVWNNRRFRKIAASHGLSDLPGASGVYADPLTGRLFSLFLPRNNVVYLIDGTIVYIEPEVHEFYDHRVYVKASLVVRIARMIRRFNRNEVYGSTAKNELEYVGFLLDEARSCADSAIATQLPSATLVVRSSSETLSNILDLYYLQQGLSRRDYERTYGITHGEIEGAIEEELATLKATSDPAVLASIRGELNHLIESKHLLVLDGSEIILSRLHEAFMR